MAKAKKPAKQETDAASLGARQRAAAEVLLKLGGADDPAGATGDHATAWGAVRSKEELLAALPPLPATGLAHADGLIANSLAHASPVPVSDKRGVFHDSGASGKNRVSRTGHKP